jgi:putative transposase
LRLQVELHEDEFVVMPNHVHGIVWLVENVGARHRRAPTEKFGKPVSGSIPTIIRAYKSAVTYSINKSQNSRGSVLWQRNYYEHVIRNERELDLIAKYIHYNPFNWQVDRDNVQNTRNLSVPESIEDYLKDAEEILGVKTT